MARGQSEARRSGFTLIEALAMLAITSVIMVGVTALIHDVSRNFDRGTRGASNGERLLLAVERIAQDFGSARFVLWNSKNGPAVAFTADASSDDGSMKVVFVGSAGVMSGPQGDEVVTLTIEQNDDGVTQLVRRRAPWTGSRMRAEDIVPSDPVVLIEGKVDISFQFARIGPNGALEWSESWTRTDALPRFVRLIVRDRASGRDLLSEADFVVRADAPAGCGRPDANPACLASALSDAPRSLAPGSTAQ
jgi:Tfp pilus assembly protein PilV